jgi:mannose-6-phosphate isomerase-like protein (cupin superfamily)
MNEFAIPKDHINFLAKKLFDNCGEIIDGSIAYLDVGGGGPIELHTHDHSHLFIVISGQARIRLGDKVKIVEANESFLVDGKIPHSVWNNADEQTVMIGISVKKN